MAKAIIKLKEALFIFIADNEHEYEVKFWLDVRKFQVMYRPKPPNHQYTRILLEGDIAKNQVITADYAKQLLGKFPDNA
jgi:hypothetical protein